MLATALPSPRLLCTGHSNMNTSQTGNLLGKGYCHYQPPPAPPAHIWWQWCRNAESGQTSVYCPDIDCDFIPSGLYHCIYCTLSRVSSVSTPQQRLPPGPWLGQMVTAVACTAWDTLHNKVTSTSSALYSILYIEKSFKQRSTRRFIITGKAPTRAFSFSFSGYYRFHI